MQQALRPHAALNRVQVHSYWISRVPSAQSFSEVLDLIGRVNPTACRRTGLPLNKVPVDRQQ